MSRFGVDYAWGFQAGDEKALRMAGVTFAARYISHDSSKDETLAEAKALASQGIDSVLVFESTPQRPELGYSAGVEDATVAAQHLVALQVPSTRPVYWAVDYETTLGPHITAYAAGWQKVLPGRHGPYAGLAVVKAVFDHQLARWAWQTYAWSAGAWDPRAQLRQYSNGHTIAGHLQCDYNMAVASDFGQWRPMVPKPPVKPKPGPLPPHDVEGPWPYAPHEYLGVVSNDVHCHSGYYPTDRPHINAYQRQLEVRGWRITTDGDFGGQSKIVTEQFQKEKGLPVTGWCDSLTWDHARHDPITRK